jgi:hypothetical protein
MADRWSDVTKLPKWAQSFIAAQNKKIGELENKISELSNKHPGSNIRICEYSYEDITLPPWSEIDFYPHGTEGSRPQKISVMIRRSAGRELSICGDESLVVEPVSSNLIRVRSR